MNAFVELALKSGFRVWLNKANTCSEAGEYGVLSDYIGTRVLYFEFNMYGHISTETLPTSGCGTGWVHDKVDVWELKTAKDILRELYAMQPFWFSREYVPCLTIRQFMSMSHHMEVYQEVTIEMSRIKCYVYEYQNRHWLQREDDPGHLLGTGDPPCIPPLSTDVEPQLDRALCSTRQLSGHAVEFVRTPAIFPGSAVAGDI